MNIIYELDSKDVIAILAKYYNVDETKVIIGAKDLRDFKAVISLGNKNEIDLVPVEKTCDKKQHKEKTTAEEEIERVGDGYYTPDSDKTLTDDERYKALSDDDIVRHIEAGGNVKSLCNRYKLPYEKYKWNLYERIKKLRKEGVSIRELRKTRDKRNGTGAEYTSEHKGF